MSDLQAPVSAPVTAAFAALPDSASPEVRLAALGIVLPPVPPPAGDYAPWVRTGNLIVTSGQLPWIAGDLMFKGRIGTDLSLQQGYDAFRLSTLNVIALLKSAVGELGAVRQIVRLEGSLHCAPGFEDQARVLNGASHLIAQVFGPQGRHTRMVYSDPAMVLGAATLVCVTAEV